MTEDERKTIILGLLPPGAVFLRRKSGGFLWRPKNSNYVEESNVWLAGLYDPAAAERDYGDGKSEHSRMIDAAERVSAWGAPDGTVIALLADEIGRLREQLAGGEKDSEPMQSASFDDRLGEAMRQALTGWAPGDSRSQWIREYVKPALAQNGLQLVDKGQA